MSVGEVGSRGICFVKYRFVLSKFVEINFLSAKSKKKRKKDIKPVVGTCGAVIEECVDFAHVGASLEVNFTELSTDCFLIIHEVFVIDVGPRCHFGTHSREVKGNTLLVH